MRVAVVFFIGKNRQRLRDIAEALATGIESQGHQVDLIDGDRDVNKKLTAYQYIAFGTEAISAIGGKIPKKISQFLAESGVVNGKRSFAFVLKSLLGTQKAVLRLMKCMEHEGMYLKNSQILNSREEAEVIGKKLHIDSTKRL
jgi:flavorubredoxin